MHRDRGLGSALLRGLRAEAAERQVPLRHSVYRANTEAFRFYERLGFAVVAEADAYALMEYLPEG
jgi:ribosomal protein S18 acetylase RimI-like enzyme